MPTVYMTSGRFQPPTKGHELILRELISRKGPNDKIVVAISHTVAPRHRNPLPPLLKKDLFEKYKNNIDFQITHGNRQFKNIVRKELLNNNKVKVRFLFGNDQSHDYLLDPKMYENFWFNGGRKSISDIRNGNKISNRVQRLPPLMRSNGNKLTNIMKELSLQERSTIQRIFGKTRVTLADISGTNVRQIPRTNINNQNIKVVRKFFNLHIINGAPENRINKVYDILKNTKPTRSKKSVKSKNMSVRKTITKRTSRSASVKKSQKRK